MICEINLANNHLYPGLWASSFRLRKQIFVDSLKWHVPIYGDMEQDQFDGVYPHYLAAADEMMNCIGLARMISTENSFMIKELWPDMVPKEFLEMGEKAVEVSRFCVAPTLPNRERKNVRSRMILSLVEYCIHHGKEGYLLLSSPRNMALNEEHGLEVVRLGEPVLIDDLPCLVGWVPITPKHEESFRRTTGIQEKVTHRYDQALIA